jgi:hypothetical protein
MPNIFSRIRGALTICCRMLVGFIQSERYLHIKYLVQLSSHVFIWHWVVGITKGSLPSNTGRRSPRSRFDVFRPFFWQDFGFMMSIYTEFCMNEYRKKLYFALVVQRNEKGELRFIYVRKIRILMGILHQFLGSETLFEQQRVHCLRFKCVDT